MSNDREQLKVKDSKERERLRQLFARQSHLMGDIKRMEKCITELKYNGYVMGAQRLIEKWGRILESNKENLEFVNSTLNSILYR